MIGIYEDIFSDSNDIKIEYYSDEDQSLKKFIQKYKDLKIEPNNDKTIDEESCTGYCWTFSINKKDFLKNTKEIVRAYIKNYIKIKEVLEIEE